MKTACANCPWRLSNQGKRTPWGFYTKANIKRLWNGLRRGGSQSCHPTDPTHPDHVAAGAKPGAQPQECPGSVIVVLREVRRMADPSGCVLPEGIVRYKQERKRHGLTKRGLVYWLVHRIHMGGVPMVGGPKLPEVNLDDPEVGLPPELIA